MVVPAETPFTNPAELTVATAGAEEIQGFVAAAVAEPVNWEVEPIHENKVPVIVGEALMVKV
jgi:hypothetical protein